MTPIIIAFWILCVALLVVIVLYGLFYFINKIVEHSFMMVTIQKEMLAQFVKLNESLQQQKTAIEKLES